mmetsp:Transcript_7053/g.20597  ORF Transcript_7053/g.20597 Transcript_7053/m.20597 type:complete len:247 (-) Transcript_7053:682-1422(-)
MLRSAATARAFARRTFAPTAARSLATMLLGSEVPNFTCASTEGEINFHEYIDGSWAILASHPRAFTPVCTTELGFMAAAKGEFDKRGVKVMAISADTVEENLEWSKDIKEVEGTEVNFPIFCDADRSVCELYNMLEAGDDTAMPATVRSVFVIGPDKKLKLSITYPPSTGRNFDEILRVVDSLQLTANKSLATPVNWVDGEKAVILPSVSKEDADAKFPGYQAVKPYLRYTAEGVTNHSVEEELVA